MSKVFLGDLSGRTISPRGNECPEQTPAQEHIVPARAIFLRLITCRPRVFPSMRLYISRWAPCTDSCTKEPGLPWAHASFGSQLGGLQWRAQAAAPAPADLGGIQPQVGARPARRPETLRGSTARGKVLTAAWVGGPRGTRRAGRPVDIHGRRPVGCAVGLCDSRRHWPRPSVSRRGARRRCSRGAVHRVRLRCTRGR